ncbi:hypothetical protein SAMN05660691_03433 [Rheinheimera pacifica]|uniref:DUF3137 domain-containing protein n=2 Tax=Rheinheimera pacifica TaxID=173990 RepID=A0A1H6NDE2_9GAMM|nr:hypothetical protein SAMN05660691_03433 [Rheinheimera pacifica]
MAGVATHNNKLKQLLAELTRRSRTATTVQDLLEITELAARFNAPLVYRNQLQYVLAAVFVLAGALLLFFQHQYYLYIRPSGWTGFTLLMTAAAGLLLFALSRNRSISRLSNDIFTKNVLFDNQLKPLAEKDVANQLLAAFLEFKRGNYSRKIEQLYQGHSASDNSSFSYYFYHFHYVDKRRETYTESDGKGGTRIRTRTVYDHYHRYGICVPEFKNPAVMVYSHAPEHKLPAAYRPASNRFNNHYRVQSTDEMQAARLMKPAVVIAFEDLYPILQRPNVELQPDAGLCLSFNDNNLLLAKRQYSLQQPQLFRQEIAAHTPLDKLHQALHFIHHLANHAAISLQDARL